MWYFWTRSISTIPTITDNDDLDGFVVDAIQLQLQVASNEFMPRFLETHTVEKKEKEKHAVLGALPNWNL